MADLTIIQDIYDIPTPTRITTWGIPEKKAPPMYPGWKDPIGFAPDHINKPIEAKIATFNSRKGVTANYNRGARNSRPVYVRYKDGSREEFPSVSAAYRSINKELRFSKKKVQEMVRDGFSWKGVSIEYKEEL